MLSSPLAEGVTFEEVLDAVRDHTNVLLGTTITYSAEDWAQPSRLQGWTRSHVAAHLAHNARGLLRVCDGLAQGRPERMYDSDQEKVHAIEVDALSDGLTLQIALDTTAGELQERLPHLEHVDTPLTLRAGYQVPAQLIPLTRLYEVTLHLFDLSSEATELAPLPAPIANALLAYEAERIGERPDFPSVDLAADEGFRGRIGAGQRPTRVSGPAAHLLAWVARGVESPDLVTSLLA